MATDAMSLNAAHVAMRDAGTTFATSATMTTTATTATQPAHVDTLTALDAALTGAGFARGRQRSVSATDSTPAVVGFVIGAGGPTMARYVIVDHAGPQHYLHVMRYATALRATGYVVAVDASKPGGSRMVALVMTLPLRRV